MAATALHFESRLLVGWCYRLQSARLRTLSRSEFGSKCLAPQQQKQIDRQYCLCCLCYLPLFVRQMTRTLETLVLPALSLVLVKCHAVAANLQLAKFWKNNWTLSWQQDHGRCGVYDPECCFQCISHPLQH